MKKDENSIGIPHNAIALGTEIKAALIKATEGMRIDGIVRGNIECPDGRIVIGSQALIEGNILCGDIEIMGTVLGEVKSLNTCSLLATARVVGNLNFKSLSVAFGAKFSGQCTYVE